ncbi:hypothetical protein RSAG8_06635, partial [Rhizoctonia solani AG-8 WAC10335]
MPYIHQWTCSVDLCMFFSLDDLNFLVGLPGQQFCYVMAQLSGYPFGTEQTPTTMRIGPQV